MAAADFENLLKASMGLNVASIGASAIERAVQGRLTACHLDVGAYWDLVSASATELQELTEAVVVPETWFFRDREAFVALAQLARQEWLDRPDQVFALLSLPCSTGEEPYSMAMALLDASLPAERFRIDAVDISTRVLARADHGIYGRNSFRGDDLAFRGRHFDSSASEYRVRETVRTPVHFHWGNLFASNFLPGSELYDVIFCRNVLIYFDRATQDRALEVLKRLLKAKGVLFVAPAETALPVSHGLVSTNLPLAYAFRRSTVVPRRTSTQARADEARPAFRQAAWPWTGSSATREAAAIPAAQATSPVPGGRPAAPQTTAISQATRLADQGHFVEAATCCEAHLRRHGPSAAAFHLMGLVRDATGNQREAVAFYRKALYLEPNRYETQIHLALLMEKQGDAAGARILRARARRLEEPGIAHE